MTASFVQSSLVVTMKEPGYEVGVRVGGSAFNFCNNYANSQRHTHQLSLWPSPLPQF